MSDLTPESPNPYAPPRDTEALGPDHERGRSYAYVSAEGLSTALTVLLGLCILTFAASIVSSFMELELLERMEDGGTWTMAEAEANDTRELAVTGALGVCFLLAGVVWCVWQARTSKNLRALGARDMRFGPHAWGWFFCPILNLWRPFQVIAELWTEAAPEGGEEGPKTPRLLALWWGAWIIGGVSSRFADRYADPEQLDTVIHATQGNMLTMALYAAAGVLAIQVVRGLQARVRARYEARRAGA